MSLCAHLRLTAPESHFFTPHHGFATRRWAYTESALSGYDLKPGASRGRIVPGEPKPPSGETPPLALPRKAWPQRRRQANGHPLTAGPHVRPTRVPLVSLSSPRATSLARPQDQARAGRGCGAAASWERGGGAGSAGPGRARFRVPGPAGKLSRRGRPLPGWRRGAELRFTCPPYQRRRRRRRRRRGAGAGRRAAAPAGSPAPLPPPCGGLGPDHPAAPIPAPAESGAARRREASRAPFRKLRGGGSQGRVLLAAAPGTSQPPRRRRRSHRDRKPLRRTERPPLAPRTVPDEGWSRVTFDPS
ncbi:uncharacterized protein [Kogia breviceps]|uniref:uncharacterized protein n=1 Tax=Kogia breviceps TaxID=27615 RepID=UPI0034D36C15